MRATIKTDPLSGHVLLEYDSTDSGETRRVSREFTAPLRGGYVREVIGSEWRQICEGLYSTGSTLSCSSSDRLETIIRREWKRRRSLESRSR